MILVLFDSYYGTWRHFFLRGKAYCEYLKFREKKKSLQNTKTIDWCSWIILVCIAYQYLVNIERLPLAICHKNRDNFMFSRSYVSSSVHGHRYEFKDRFHTNKPSFYGHKNAFHINLKNMPYVKYIYEIIHLYCGCR